MKPQVRSCPLWANWWEVRWATELKEQNLRCRKRERLSKSGFSFKVIFFEQVPNLFILFIGLFDQLEI